MLNRYPLWKNLLIILVLVISTLIALPNVFGEDPSVQISPTRTTLIDDDLVANVKAILAQEKLTPKRIDRSDERLLIRFTDTTDQLRAKDFLAKGLGRQYNIALNLSADTPRFLQALGLNPMYLGLDLRGGVHFLMEIDMHAVTAQLLESHSNNARAVLQNKSIQFDELDRMSENAIKINFSDVAQLRMALNLLSNDQNVRGLDWTTTGNSLIGEISQIELNERRGSAIQQNITTLRNRVNELGVAEPIITQQGADRIVVQLPGVQDTAKAKEILGSTATLEFRIVDERSDSMARTAAQTGRAPLGTKLFFIRDTAQPILLKRQVILTGDSIVNANAGMSQQTGLPEVQITLNSAGADAFGAATKLNLKKPMATVFIENRVETVEKDGIEERRNIVTEEVVNVATIQSQLFQNFVISGINSLKEANDLAILLRSGALAAPIQIIEERTVGPSAGKENISKGFQAAVVGLLLIMVFMALRYRAFGLVANVALFANLILIIALLSLLQATLTLPGIAGIILSLGMSVDANVLIYERIREDLKKGLSPQIAINSGFERAFGTIMDANITSLIAALVLFGIGSGPIKGFAITLTFGIITSVFTAVFMSRAIVNFIWGNRKIKSLPIGGRELIPFLRNEMQINFMKGRKWYVTSCLVFIVAALGICMTKGFNYGLDFTGGTVIEVHFEQPVDVENIKLNLNAATIENALVQYFGSSQDIMIRLPAKAGDNAAQLSSEILSALKQLETTSELRRVEFVGPQVGKELVTGGVLASLVAIMGILLYIWFRFEWKLAIGTILSTVHDTFIVVGLFSLLQLEFDLTALASILAVIGYSVNDTVVVLDRIRENFLSSRKGSALEVVNIAINQTMSRTIMTSLTTFLSVLALYLFGGSAVESFALAMMVGVVVGTYSSIFVAAAGALVMGLSRDDLIAPKKETEAERFKEGYGTEQPYQPSMMDFLEGEAIDEKAKKIK